MNLQLALKSDTKLEFAFGKIAHGKEGQLFGEYFPAIFPLITEYGCQQAGTFIIKSSNYEGEAPQMGALTCWPNEENFNRFFNDPRFLKVKPLRDDSMALFSDGHFFNSVDKVTAINTDADYALIITNAQLEKIKTLFCLPLEVASPTQTFADKSLFLALWDENSDELLATNSSEATVFRIQFNVPNA